VHTDVCTGSQLTLQNPGILRAYVTNVLPRRNLLHVYVVSIEGS
jgi:hypothetical protein